ncbi:MAG: hypothetical protein J4215_01275 [Candidatus Diapherotrites archaeon]|uniref:Class III signal peptide-containing protein n=1 Tax=Candidatus Iainarchaeum sp. TaxID=3101447 RepID=A0A8T4LE68_9ARCH|nr:hypothetical protein [Candidatus Diapherotrites archaeon]
MKLLQEKRAQNSMETLIMVGGAILVAVTVGLIVKQAANQLGNAGNQQIGNTP